MMGGNTNHDSKNIMHLIEEGTVGAEIGVWKGSSSRQFVKKNLKKLYLVDPWAVSGYDEAIEANDPTFSLDAMLNKDQYVRQTGGNTVEKFTKYYDDVAEKVIKEFADNKEVEVHRMTATEWFNQFDKPFLDWIYVDGDHSYTGCYNDLCNALKAVKKGGLILGDDYKWHSDGDKGGVKKAVNQFVEENNLTLNKHGKVQWSIHV